MIPVGHGDEQSHNGVHPHHLVLRQVADALPDSAADEIRRVAEVDDEALLAVAIDLIFLDAFDRLFSLFDLRVGAFE